MLKELGSGNAKADAGMGLTAGLSIAILADRLIQAWIGARANDAGQM